MSICQGSRYTAQEPFLLPPPWSTYNIVCSITFNIGTIPFDTPLVPTTGEPVPLTSCIERPMPPADLLILAQSLMVEKIPSILSFSIYKRKHEENY